MATQKRIDEQTPNGGAYSIMFFFDDNDKLVEEKEATKFIVKEYDKNDNIIIETNGFLEK